MYHVYLAGPITSLSFNNATNWREKFIEDLPAHILGLNPMRGQDYLKHEKELKPSYDHIALSSAKGIFTQDFFDVKRSDLIVANLLGATKVSIGTTMEIAWAKAFNIPIILVIEKTGNIHCHPFVQECAGFRVDNLDEALMLTKIILPSRPFPFKKIPLDTDQVINDCLATRSQ